MSRSIIHHMLPHRQHPALWAMRFGTGLPMTGKWSTNAGWFQRGTRYTSQRGTDSRTDLAYRAGWERMVYRWTCTAGAAGFGTAMLLDTDAALAWAGTGTAAVLIPWTVSAVLDIRNRTWGQRRKFNRRPLPRLSLRPGSGLVLASGRRARVSWDVSSRFIEAVGSVLKIESPRVQLDKVKSPTDGYVAIDLPPTWPQSEANYKRLVTCVETNLHGEWVATWPKKAGHDTAVFTRPGYTPDVIEWADVQDETFGLADGEFLIGVDGSGRPELHDYDNEAPHAALSMATGGGKSSWLRTQIVQAIRKGHRVVVLDTKRTSLNEFRGHPNVVIVRDVTAVVEAIEEVQAENELRQLQAEAADADGDPAPDFQRLFLVVEELVDLKIRLMAIPDKELRENLTERFMNALYGILVTGRTAQVHCLLAAQRLDASLLGRIGGLARTQFGLRLLWGADKATWAMLGDGTKFLPFSKRKGFVKAVLSGETTDMRTPLLTANDARRMSEDHAASTVAGRSSTPINAPTSENTVATSQVPITLSSFAEETGMSLSALRKASDRDEEFPPALAERKPGVTAHYELTALHRWATNRQRSTV